MGFNNMWILLNDVLPRAIQKHGGFGPDALAKAARETDIPEGGTMQGYGVKFYPPGHRCAGQNKRAVAAVFQVVDGEFKHVYPRSSRMAKPPVLLPASSPFPLAERSEGGFRPPSDGRSRAGAADGLPPASSRPALETPC